MGKLLRVRKPVLRAPGTSKNKGFLKVLKDSKGKISNLFLFFWTSREVRCDKRDKLTQMGGVCELIDREDRYAHCVSASSRSAWDYGGTGARQRLWAIVFHPVGVLGTRQVNTDFMNMGTRVERVPTIGVAGRINMNFRLRDRGRGRGRKGETGARATIKRLLLGLRAGYIYRTWLNRW
jgi:hypothetical protein